MHNVLPALVFIAIILSPCLSATWTLRTPRVKAKKQEDFRAPQPEVRLRSAFVDAPASSSNAILLRCERSSQMRHRHVHGTTASGDVTLQMLRPVAHRV
jgi:hypothetical protein